MEVSQYFKDYPGSKKCYKTSDGLIFHEEGDANAHAKSLSASKVTTHSKEDLNEDEPTEITEPIKSSKPVKGKSDKEPKVKKKPGEPLPINVKKEASASE
jgi:hypothetical protein